MSEIADKVMTNLGLDAPDDIKHFGVKGMKWGVVRERGANGRVSGKMSEDHVTSRELKARPRSSMSNAELRKLNERLQLEKSNNELQSRSALQKIKTGTSIAGTILAVGTTVTTAYNFAKSPAGQAIVNAVKKSK